MLHAISWKEFFITVGLSVVLYYGWWLIRFYPGLRAGRPGAAGRKEIETSKKDNDGKE